MEVLKEIAMKLLVLGIITAILAAPAPAVAEGVFTHEGIPIEGEEVLVEFEGPMEWEIADESGVHCPNVLLSIRFRNGITSTVAQYAPPTNCTVTRGPAQGFPVHTIPLEIHGNSKWQIHSNASQDRLGITEMAVQNTITHPSTPHLCVAVSTLEGDFFADVDENSSIQTITLDNEVGELTLGEVNADISGHLVNSTGTSIGQE